MFANLDWFFLLPGLILLIAVIDDLRSRKIHNHLILFMLPVVLIAVFLFKGLAGLQEGALSAVLALLVIFPLFLGRIVGGGDLKLLVLVAFSLNWTDFFRILIYSFPWALILGLVKVILDKKIKDFFTNLFFLVKYRKAQGLEMHSIPFSVALFTAWLSFMTLQVLS